MRTVMVLMTPDIIDFIRSVFQKMEVGEAISLAAPHRDENDTGKSFSFSVLPKDFEVPNTFSFEQIIRDAMKHECEEAHKDFEEVPPEMIEAGVTSWPGGHDKWKFMGMHVDYETGYIHAMIKKI